MPLDITGQQTCSKVTRKAALVANTPPHSIGQQGILLSEVPGTRRWWPAAPPGPPCAARPPAPAAHRCQGRPAGPAAARHPGSASPPPARRVITQSDPKTTLTQRISGPPSSDLKGTCFSCFCHGISPRPRPAENRFQALVAANLQMLGRTPRRDKPRPTRLRGAPAA